MHRLVSAKCIQEELKCSIEIATRGMLKMSLGMENAQGLLRLQQNGMQLDATVFSCCDEMQ